MQPRLAVGHAQAQHGFGRTLDEDAMLPGGSAVARGHHLGVGVERQFGLAWPLLAKCLHFDASLGGDHQQSGLGWVTQHAPLRQVVQRGLHFGVVAQHDGLQQRGDGQAGVAVRKIDRRVRFAELALRRVAHARDGDEPSTG